MAVPSEVSLMDILFDRDDPVLKFMDDKEIFKPDQDTITDKLDCWTNDDDLLKGILSDDLEVLGDAFDLEENEKAGLNPWQMEVDLAMDIKTENLSVGSPECYSDSGYSNGQVSPGLATDYGFSPDRDDEDDQMSSTISTTSDSSLHQMLDEEQSSQAPLPEPPKKKVRQVMKVSPMLSANPRSVLLPVNTANGVRTFKIVTPAGGIKAIKPMNPGSPLVIKSLRANVLPMVNRTGRSISSNLKRVRARSLKPVSVSVAGSDDEVNVVSDEEETRIYEKQQYPRLMLSPEERKLMQKEGVSLPTHYPLTKSEERELKRIRRKIRNKISAQDSRKRKKEYLDGLEDRVRKCTQENMTLVKKIKYLQSHNQSLVAQLKKLQAALAAAGRGAKSSAQPATCLMVLILSVALVMAPSLRLTQNNDLDIAEQDVSLTEKALPPIAGRTRSLLSSEAAIEEELLSLGAEQEIPAELHELLRFHAADSASESRKSSVSWTDVPHFLADHDYGPPPPKRQFLDREYTAKHMIIPPVDDVWPPPKIEKHLDIPDVDDEWLPKGSRLLEDTITTEVKVNVSDGTGTRTVVIQVPKEKK